ncbi:acyl--CoA ligase [Pseudomonas tolaasii]|uniref:class I adenylate-forming enzyme family protein n=1 Tax=Pseudomonas tolaasii TaxID=29442 RepID=UPI001C575146|nr:class I adenylate-forming enzyme family protein [Pseudomonas tolaasii]MBW1245134.1 acyl--CoA ligase [Pseudomonas tolaasii]
MLTCFEPAQAPAPSQTPLHALFQHAAERPNAIALIADGDVWSYHRLANEVVRLSNGFKHAGVEPGDRIVMLVRTSPLYAVFLFAAMMSGAIMVPLKTEFTARELDEFLGWLRPKLFIHEADLQPVISQMDAEVLGRTRTLSSTNWESLLGEGTRQTGHVPADIDSTCLLLATSGTTGMPKLVAYNQRAISHVAGALEAWKLDAGSCTIGSTPVAHVSGSFVLMATIIKGCREVMFSRFDADKLLDAIEQEGGSMLFVAPFICQPLVDAQRKRPRDLSSLQVCGIGGDACRPPVAETFQSTFDFGLNNTYGLTECLGSMAFGSAWDTLTAVPGRARLVDADGAVVAQGQVGELQMCGPNLSLGYWTGPGDIISHSRDGWFSSGDLMFQEPNGEYRFVGRCKDQIVSFTDKISPVEVENQLILHPAVADAAVAGAPDSAGGQRVVVLVKRVPDATATADEILAWLRERLAPFKLPQRIVLSDVIPRNALGKVDRNEVVRIVSYR